MLEAGVLHSMSKGLAIGVPKGGREVVERLLKCFIFLLTFVVLMSGFGFGRIGRNDDIIFSCAPAGIRNEAA